MTATFFIPKKINIGFQNRQGTYTGSLAYIIYFDEKGKLRKEKSWNGWRDKDIENQIHDNEPTSGFVLNKKVGDYVSDWNHRQAYVRVYDPRGFEFEITIQNLLYILENATSTKGKGLEGDFVYGWSGKDLVLIPVGAPDYVELVKLNALRHAREFVKTKELKIGATYRTKNNEELVYIGRFDEYGYYGEKKLKTQFFFYKPSTNCFSTMASISQQLVEVVSEECIDNYSEIFELLESKTMYSPIDKEAYEYVDYTLEEVLEVFANKDDNGYYRRYLYVYVEKEGAMVKSEIMNYSHEDKPCYYDKREVEYKVNNYGWVRNGQEETRTRIETVRVYAESIADIFHILKPKWRKVYLVNGKLHKEEK